MAGYSGRGMEELSQEVARLEDEAAQLKAKGLSLDMTRGKPCPDQIDISKPMFDLFDSATDLHDGGFDAGNYGCPQGLPSARRFFADMLHVPQELVYVGGSSSLNIMFDIVSHCYVTGLRGARA